MWRVTGVEGALREHEGIKCKIRLVGSGLNGEVVVDGANKIKSEKLREQQ